MLVYGPVLLLRALSLSKPGWSKHWLCHRVAVPLLEDIKYSDGHAMYDNHNNLTYVTREVS